MFQSGVLIATRSLCCLAHASQDSIKHAATCSRIPQKCSNCQVSNSSLEITAEQCWERFFETTVCQVARYVQVKIVKLQLHFNSS